MKNAEVFASHFYTQIIVNTIDNSVICLNMLYKRLCTGAVGEGQGWEALGGLYALLAQHDALDGHALARKSVRSPSRRLRFGRRSDPDMPAQAPVILLLNITNESVLNL